MPVPFLRLLAAGFAILAGVAVFSPAGQAADRFVAWLADGKKLTATTLPSWPVPGLALKLGTQDVWGAKNPVRLVRDRSASITLRPPFLVLANGDVLTGTPTQLEPDEGRQGEPTRVMVQLEQLLPISGTGVPVRTDRIARIVNSSEAAARVEPPPGTVELADGRRLTARSIRWREYGLSILTPEGIVEANYPEIAQAVFDVDRTAAVLDDCNWASGTAGTIARFQLTGGSIITTSRISRETERTRRRVRGREPFEIAYYYYVQPAWADQSFALPEAAVAACGYREADEAPLSLLPAELLTSRRLIGTGEPLVRNHSADGALPASGQFETDLGIATHAHSEIAFDLPPGAKSLITAVGLDRAVGEGGCVRCKIVGVKAESKTLTPALSQGEREKSALTPALSQGERELLWDSDILLGSYGPKPTGPIDVADFAKVILITEMAHEGRPPGADPLDIRDAVCWLAPVVRLEEASDERRIAAVLGGLRGWQLAGDWDKVQLATRWNWSITGWETVLTYPRGSRLTLSRTMLISRECDVLELSTVCPADLALHDLVLTVGGERIDWHPSADREHVQTWLNTRYFRARAGFERFEEGLLSDRLAYWWDLQKLRGHEAALTLTFGGSGGPGEISWRGFSLRSAVLNPAAKDAAKPDVPLTSLEPLRLHGPRGVVVPERDGLPGQRFPPPIRFLGQLFSGGYGMREGSAIEFALRPEFRKFVATVGCCANEAGPLTVRIDGKIVWEKPLVQGTSPAERIEIDIPAGAKTLTLASEGSSNRTGHAAWAEAGFVTK